MKINKINMPFFSSLNAEFDVRVTLIYTYSHGHKDPRILRNVNYFCGVYINDLVHERPLKKTYRVLKDRIRAALRTVRTLNLKKCV